ncbi:MAG TPA: PEP/pyruvate-binding domain-containing protein [Roseiflexaceae bacterium]|nr:PEP/pyruvate-binding domain-containing protein [Roseiflexaceae bacterium]
MDELQAVLADLALPDGLRAAVRRELEETFGDLGPTAFAVRSSAVDEDTEGASFAGVYRTTLGAQGLGEVCAAILDCWRAYYDYPAVLARIRAGTFSPEPGMAVIIQRMVPAHLAGVAFTVGSAEADVVVEYVHGLGEALVAGTAAAADYRPGDSRARPPQEQAVLEQLAQTVAALRQRLGYDLDVEWAWAPDELAIVQVRPVTAGLRGADSPERRTPHFAYARLYLDEVLPTDLELGEARSIYASYVAKRAPVYRRAAAAGVRIGAAYVLSFDGPGLLAEAARLDALLGATPAAQVVLDISPTLRQIIIDKRDVCAYLTSAFGLGTSKQRHAVIVRDYVRGQYGFISLPLGADGLLLEYSPDGLLAINRGLAACSQIVWDDRSLSPRVEPAGVDAQASLAQWLPLLPAIHAFTHALNRDIAGCQLEWVLEDGEPYFVDYSAGREGDIQAKHQGGAILSPGVASGPLLWLDDDELLARLSIGPVVSVGKTEEIAAHGPFRLLIDHVAGLPRRPVVFAKYPYAALAVLLDHVAGFVFEQGSLLCHLAILLREARIPAVVASALETRTQAEVLIDHQHVTLLTPSVPARAEEGL